jgi:transcriptional regulator of acetoin/glycerol metabolism
MRSPPRFAPGPITKSRGREEPVRPIAAGLKLDEAHVDSIEQSHQRCVALGVSRIERPDLTPLGHSDLAVVRERNLRLHDHAAPVMEMLHEQIRASQSMVVLTDATGTILHSIGDDDFLERASKVALRPGANWSESAKGTNAVGTALVAETPTLVHADEHFLHANHFLTCSAAPILDPRGNILGVLDVSGDYRSYHQHTMALVKMSARMIENRWLSDDYRNVMRLHFHSRVEFIGTLMEGILAVSADGRIVGANRGALEQLGLSGVAVRKHTLDSLFGTSVGALVDRFRSPLATPAPSAQRSTGRQFHLLARFNWPVWSSLAEAISGVAPPAPAPAAAAAAPPARETEGTALARLCTGEPAFDGLVDKVRRIVGRGIPLLIVGESGSGRTALARAFHDDADGRHGPFVALHCASTPADALEAELFGTDAGTGRDGARAGRLAQALGGTLFLHEVGELPATAQRRLLNVLQQGQFTPPGQGAPLPLDLAIVCASGQPLSERVAQGLFAEELYHRLNGLSVRLPALRERQDLPVLVQRALQRCGAGRPPEVAEPTMLLLRQHRWPGNLRQLFGLLNTARLMLQPHEVQITPAHLPEDFLDAAGSAADALAPSSTPSPRTLGDVQIETIRAAVQDCRGNISEAAKRLGVSRNTIYRKLRGRSG